MTQSIFRFLVVAAVLGAAGGAYAQPEVRDHRFQGGVQVSPASSYRRRPGPPFMLPLAIQIGATGANTRTGFAPGIAASIGVHWASLSPMPTNTDIGVGAFAGLLSAPLDASNASSIEYGGGYLEIAQTLSHGSFWRTWGAGRGEYLASSAYNGPTHRGFGVSGRLSAELYISGIGIAPGTLFLGTYAIGVYAEVAARDLAAGVGTLQGSVGLTFRTPLVVAL